MPNNESHAIRNGIIATVVGGIILSLIPSIREFAIKTIHWLWSILKWVLNATFDTYTIQGWLLALISFFALIGLGLLLKSIPRKKPEYYGYIEDVIYNTKWRWKWANNQISSLWCYCPHCEATLVYDDSSCRNYLNDNRTNFICERCNDIVTSISGGNLQYATSAVEREIDRRIRTEEYKRILTN